MLSLAARDAYHAVELNDSWRECVAKVTKSVVRHSLITGSLKQYRNATSYSLDIEYEYVIDDKLYRGNKFSLSSLNTAYASFDQAKKELKNFPLGQRVPCFYDIEKPFNSVLKKSITHNWALHIVAILVFLLFPLVILLRHKKSVAMVRAARDYKRKMSGESNE